MLVATGARWTWLTAFVGLDRGQGRRGFLLLKALCPAASRPDQIPSPRAANAIGTSRRLTMMSPIADSLARVPPTTRDRPSTRPKQVILKTWRSCPAYELV